MSENVEWDVEEDLYTDLPETPREAAEQIERGLKLLSRMSATHGLSELAELLELARSEADRQAKLPRIVN